MNEPSDIIRRVRQSAAKRVLFLPHAIRQMSSPGRMISTGDIRAVIEHGELIEDYPQDPLDLTSYGQTPLARCLFAKR